MDLFRFRSAPNAPMSNGEIVIPGDSVTWVERYREPGEVEIEAEISSGLREQLPVGTVVSHLETKEIMRIEDHEISDGGGDDDPVVKITGRSLEAPLLESRAAGSNITFPTLEEPIDYIIPAWTTATQAVSIIQRHIDAEYLIDDNDAIPYLDVINLAPSTGLTSEERKIKAGSVYQRLSEILDVDYLGIRTERPVSGQTNARLVIHKGVDRSDSVILSADRGDVDSVGYLQSDRKKKNCALIVGRWCQTRVVNAAVSGYDRRWMVIDASDIDEGQPGIPTGTTRAFIIAAMQIRGRQALARQNMVEITKAEASRDAIAAVHRKDYNVGDIVLVSGGYGATTKMRVTEYVEIQDETGFTGYPTLEFIEGETET